MDKIYEPKIREIRCTGRYCDNIIALEFDSQYIQSGNLTIYQSFKPICICGKPSAHWYPSELEIEGEQYQSRRAFRQEILRGLAENEKFKKLEKK
jgi:hypothetical protein